jgi:hypothetical protein
MSSKKTLYDLSFIENETPGASSLIALKIQVRERASTSMQLLVVFARTILVLPVATLMLAVLITNKTGGKLNTYLHAWM